MPSVLTEFSNILEDNDDLIKHYVTDLKDNGVSLNEFAKNVCYPGTKTLVFPEGGVRRALQLRVNNLSRLANGCPAPPDDFVASEQYSMNNLEPVPSNTKTSTPLPPPSPPISRNSKMSRRARNSPRSANDRPAKQTLTVFPGFPNAFVIAELISGKWTCPRKVSTSDLLRVCIPASNPQDVHMISASIHDDYQGIDVTMPTLPYSRREQPRVTNTAMEQKFGPCEASAKAFGATYVMSKERYPSQTIGLRFQDPFTQDPIFVTNKFYNDGVAADDDFNLRAYTSATPYEGETIAGMPNCRSVNAQVIFLLPIHGTIIQATVEDVTADNVQDFSALNQLVRSGNGSSFNGNVFQPCSSRSPFPASNPSSHSYHPPYSSPSIPPPAHQSTPSRHRRPQAVTRRPPKQMHSPSTHRSPSYPRSGVPTIQFSGMPAASMAYQPRAPSRYESSTSESDHTIEVETVYTPESETELGQVLNGTLRDLNELANSSFRDGNYNESHPFVPHEHDDMSVDANHPAQISSASKAHYNRGGSKKADYSGLSDMTAQISISSTPPQAQQHRQSPPLTVSRRSSRRIPRSHKNTTKYARGRDSSTSPSL